MNKNPNNESQPKYCGNKENGTQFSVLIVDDVPKNIQVVANILQPQGYRLAFAQRGEVALELVNKNNFDLILLDIMMPGMDGFEVCEALKSDPRHKDIPVVFLTAKTETDDIVRGFRLGAVDYVTKPFNSEELLARVCTHLELKTSRERLAVANKELRKLNATKDKFFSIIAHDLRNPIQSLLMSSELLHCNYEKLAEEKIRKYLSRFHDSANHIAELLEDLLEWARSQQGKLKYNPAEISIHSLAASTVNLLREHAEKKDIHLFSQVEEKTAAFADSNMILTVIRNLVSNAIKFTPGGGEVNILAENRGAEIKVTVADTGVGIEQKDADDLFRIDTQKTSKGTDGEKGTGLGLILCREFVEKNNGCIWVESEPGKGSRFMFTLPVKA